MFLFQPSDHFSDPWLDSLQFVDISVARGLGQGELGYMDSRGSIPNTTLQVLQHTNCILPNATKNVISIQLAESLTAYSR